jgi:two-component sensor histidine kinase
MFSISEREEARLQRLHELGLLDTPAERDFDEIVELAAAICETPIALITLVDRDRQFFKARTGLSVCETPRSQSVCSFTMQGDGVLEIPDTRDDVLTRDNPLVDQPGVMMKFYAGVPLRLRDDTPLGALCVLDHAPRQLTAMQQTALETLARQVVTQIELRAALRETERTAQRLSEALALQDVLAKEIDHRVRNSLQQVSAFLRLQARRAKDEGVARELRDAQKRVNAISAIHGALYSSGSTEAVRMQSYFDALARNLAENVPDDVRLHMEAEPITLPSNRASAVAVIANEFIANSLKYAFIEGKGGEIRVDLRREGEEIVGHFADDGIGVQANGSSEGTGLGMQIITASAQQLGGKVRFLDGPGTAMELRLPAGDAA